MNDQTIIDDLIEALRCLPGIGPKSAQRMVMHLLERDRKGAVNLAVKLQGAMDLIKHCAKCRNFTEEVLCQICKSTSRDTSQLCIVENPGDVFAIEQTGHYRGLYFVLMGALSPIDGIGPEEIGLDALISRCDAEVKEVILAVSSSVEGEATAHYISEMLRDLDVSLSRIAQGIPLGGELESVDGGTLSHAINGRKTI
ncbi:MAG: recombination protein RecR [Pseudomonadales bacterium]|nr:recombination protein RecR [Pseudomonadales bacterium]